MKRTVPLLLLLCALLPAQVVKPALQADLLFPNSDFEAGTLLNWSAKGTAFANQPIKGDNAAARHREPIGQQGEYWIGTYDNYTGQPGETPGSVRGDQATGELLSVAFTITQPLIAFLMSGGHHPDREYVALLVEGKMVKKAVGHTTEPLEQAVWDVKPWIGKQAQILIKDDWGVAESWGHINADYFHYLGIGGRSLFELTPTLK
jgi:fructan beta-fructosidase